MTTRAAWPRALAALAALALGMGARECPDEGARLRVALRTETAAEAGRLAAADTFAVASLDLQRPATVATSPAAKALDTFKRAFANAARPAQSAVVDLTLPVAPPPDLVGVWLEIILFADGNRDGQWSDGETYVTAWHGGRASYRVVFVKNEGWNLVEGGEPPAYHVRTDQIVVSIDPVIRLIERQ